jgi:hypothetical protein
VVLVSHLSTALSNPSADVRFLQGLSMTQMSASHPLIWSTSAAPMISRPPAAFVLMEKEVTLKWLFSLRKMARILVNTRLVVPLVIAAIEVSYCRFDLD